MSEKARIPGTDSKAARGKKNSAPVERGFFARRKYLILGLVVLLAGGGIAAARYFPRWNNQRLVERARSLVAKKEYMQAALTIRRVLGRDPQNIAAVELVVEMSDMLKPREALSFRHQLMLLRPERVENRYGLAELAINQQNLQLADEALQGLPMAAKETARSHFLQGKLAAAKKEMADAEKHFAAAAAKDNANLEYRFEAAAWQVQYGSLETKRAARPVLEEVSNEPEYFSRAVRILATDALSYRDFARALELAERIRTNASAAFPDKLVALTMAQDAGSDRFARYLTELQEAAEREPQDAYALLTWLSRNGKALLAVEWAKRLPSEFAEKMPVPLGVAVAYATLKDWPALQPIVAEDLTEGGREGEGAQKGASAAARAWGDYEFMRLALSARALRDQGSENESKVQWGKAVATASGRMASLALMARAAHDWGWTTEVTELLWEIARDPAEARWALDELNKTYGAVANTRGLLRVAKRRLEVEPSNLNAKNNLANFSLLTDSDPAEGLRLAKEVYEHSPENPVYASTYAFALHLYGKTEEAIGIMRNLGAAFLDKPEFAAYFGIFLASEGNKEEAVLYLERAASARLLPEEQKLVADARSRASR